MSGLNARTVDSANPMRSIVPGRKFWTKTSAVPIKSRKTLQPSADFKSKLKLRLERLEEMKVAVIPDRFGPAPRTKYH